MDQSWGANEEPEAPRWSGRQILHAALIFDPDFTPEPINYQLPNRRRVPRLPHNEVGVSSQVDIREEDSGLRSTGSDDDAKNKMNNTMETQDKPHAGFISTHQATQSDQLRWDALPYHNGIVLDGKEIKDSIAAELSRQGRENEIGRYLGFIHLIPYYSEDDSSNDSSQSSPPTSVEQDKCCQNGFAVTDEELMLLDYEGTRGRRGNDALYTCTERAKSVGLEECSDEEFEPGGLMRWSQ